MSILDDAIREHLELKRAHGADESELKKLEDEAFGPAERPGGEDPFAEAPTQFMTTEPKAVEGEDDSGGRRINIADLQEPPPSGGVADAPVAPAEDAAQAAPPAEEPAAEVETASAPPEPEPPAEPAGEREAIAEQPTELFDVEAEIGSEDVPATAAPSPSDEEIVEVEMSEPRLAPAEPPTEIHASRAEAPAPAAEEDEEDEDFWSDQRLSDELDQALESPLAEEHELPYTDADTEGEAPEEEAPREPEKETPEGEAPRADYDPDTGHEDVLEDTPDFLEESPEDDELWFEQKPPKDFDFDD